MKTKRTTFLFGAGAVLPWGAPSTSDLTQLIRNSGFYAEDDVTRITELIFQILTGKFGSNENVNFETIINVIEELLIYNSQSGKKKDLPSIQSCFFTDNLNERVYNFSIKGAEGKHGYTIEVPRGREYKFSKNAYNSEKPRQFFLLHQLSEILTDICAKISEYAYHSEEFSAVNVDSKESLLFRKWISKLSEKSILRLYTLNYDRVFKILSAKENISLFEGFDTDEYIPNGQLLRANIMRIITDEKCDCHYNLHGSAFWDVLDRDKEGLPNPEIVLRAYPNLPINNTASFLEVERGKTILISNIITGFQKAQKSFIPPFHQMQSVFDKDCLISDCIYIIGYSFGDEHLNQSIKTALRYNKELKLIIIDPDFITSGKNIDFMISFSSFITASYDYQKKSNNEHQYYGGKVIVYTTKFQVYMKAITRTRLN